MADDNNPSAVQQHSKYLPIQSKSRQEQYRQRYWLLTNRPEIQRLLTAHHCSDYAVWSKIAELIGYAEEPQQ